ncbi:Phytanoyl-CoA hydroxylase-interacting protein-like [Aphelenchoides bicaudatus]|nr:Phytanoyl-CoA hydroxylase-interacting protein-like [Aphelenchoides bicaudatus]
MRAPHRQCDRAPEMSGNSWSNFKEQNWDSYFPSPPNFGNYDFPPHDRPAFFGPTRSYNPFNHQREFNHPASRYAQQRINPYTMPSQYPHQYRQEEPYFVTPNAGMVENLKHCKSDEHPYGRQRLEDFEDFSSHDETITVNVKCQSSCCIINWSLSARFSSVRYHVKIEIFNKEAVLLEKFKRDVRSFSYQYQTTPGKEYLVRINLINNSDGSIRLSSPRTHFKAIYSMSEINELFNMAVKFAGKEPVQKFIYLYRVKPTVYFDDIAIRTKNLMEKYIKDDNGHASSPINGEIRGLFFSGQLFNGTFPQTSPFGDKLFYLNAGHLISPEKVNVYFADFYCTRKGIHYVTIIVCEKNSSTDIFCKKHIKLLNFYDNPFLKVEVVSNAGSMDYNYYVNDNLHVEICYTESVHLSMGYFDSVKPLGLGSSKVGGLPNNPSCTICNPKKDTNALLPASEKAAQTPTNSQSEVSEKSTPQRQDSGDSSTQNKRKSSTPQVNEAAEKRSKVEVQKKSVLIELLEKDRSQRNYPDLSEDIAELVSDLVETVATDIDLKNFQTKIKEGFLDESLLLEHFVEETS